MGWPRVDFILVADLHNPAQMHDCNAIRDLSHNRQIVSNEDIGQPQFGLEFRQQIYDLRLHRNVKRRNRFIADNQIRL